MRVYLFLVIILSQYINTTFASKLTSNMVIPASYFVNHIEQLDRIKQNLIKFRKVSVVGISGIGKTQLVRMYTYENKKAMT